MAIIVDGNNVMGQSPGWHRDKAGARRRLLADVADYARAVRARITVVFDGAPEDGIPDGSVFRGVRVYFASPGSDADTLIERLVARAPDRHGITVVTSDRRLALECRSAGARTIRSGEFRKRMAEAVRGREPQDPGAVDAVDDESLDEWMRYFGVDSRGERS